MLGQEVSSHTHGTVHVHTIFSKDCRMSVSFLFELDHP